MVRIAGSCRRRFDRLNEKACLKSALDGGTACCFNLLLGGSRELCSLDFELLAEVAFAKDLESEGGVANHTTTSEECDVDGFTRFAELLKYLHVDHVIVRSEASIGEASLGETLVELLTTRVVASSA